MALASPDGPILVTGATGFAGGHLLRRLAGTGELAAWGRSSPRPELAGLARWRPLDLLDRPQVRAAIAALRPARIYHLAGSPQVAASWHDTARPLEANVRATAHLLDAVRRAGLACRVLVTSSAAVYAPSPAPLGEGAAIAPGNPYALSKLAQEQLALRAFADDGIAVVVARPFNHTGPWQSPDFVAPSMARQIARIERGAHEPVMRVGNLDAQRDFSDVRDVVRAYEALIAQGRPGATYNVGSGIGRSIRSLLAALLARARVPIRVETDPILLRPREVSSLVADCGAIRAETGWQPEIAFEQTLDDLLEHWRRDAATGADSVPVHQS